MRDHQVPPRRLKLVLLVHHGLRGGAELRREAARHLGLTLARLVLDALGCGLELGFRLRLGARRNLRCTRLKRQPPVIGRRLGARGGAGLRFHLGGVRPCHGASVPRGGLRRSSGVGQRRGYNQRGRHQCQRRFAFACQVDSGDRDMPTRGLEHTENDADRRSLACAVWSQQTDDFVLMNAE